MISVNSISFNSVTTDGIFPTDSTPMITNLVALWDFNDGSGETLTDSSSSNISGSMTNMGNDNWITGKVQC